MKRTARIKIAPVYEPLVAPARYKGAYGGRGSAKSHFFAGYLVARALQTPGFRFVCVREVQKTLAESVKRLIEDKIEQTDTADQFEITEREIRTPGDGVIIFQGMQHYAADRIKSLEGYDGAWVEEAQTLSQRSLTELTPTFRKAGAELWFSWNPRNPTDPVDDMFRGNAPRHDGTTWSPPPDSVVVKSTYTDNPWFADSPIAQDMAWDREHDPEKYRHVWLGDYEGRTERRVFHNWTVREFTALPDTRFYFGADWGFSVDPTVLVRCYIVGRMLFVDWEAYEVGCQITDTPRLFDKVGCTVCTESRRCDGAAPGHGMARKWPIIADSSDPQIISHMQSHGGYQRLMPAKKGVGSVEEGINFLKDYQIVVHPRCRHTIDELTSYSYKVDKITEDVLPQLEDKKNHVIDALRYAVETLRRHTPAVSTVKTVRDKRQRLRGYS